jgi:hypothetical protein
MGGSRLFDCAELDAYEDQLRNQKSRRDFVSKGDSVAKKKGELSPPG